MVGSAAPYAKSLKKLLQDCYTFLRDSLTIGIWAIKICFVWELELDGGHPPPQPYLFPQQTTNNK